MGWPKGKKRPPETTRVGKKHSSETRAKMRAAKLGKKHSPERLAKRRSPETVVKRLNKAGLSLKHADLYALARRKGFPAKEAAAFAIRGVR